jgi:phosphoribosylpyrophosphate synthetase
MSVRTDVPYSGNGGLTLVPLPGFEDIAKTLKEGIERKGKSTNKSTGKNENETPVDIAIPKFGLRPSGECYVQLSSTHIKGHDCFIICSGPGTNNRIMRLIYTVGYLAAREAKRITIVSGYFMHGRSDKDEKRDELALPPFIYDAIKGVSQGLLRRIIAADVHAPQVTMAGDPGRIVEIELKEKLLGHLLDEAANAGFNDVVIAFPDDTAGKRFEETILSIEEKRGIKLACVTTFARRKSDRTKEIIAIVGDTDKLKGALVIQVDDESATGGSQINAAEMYIDLYGAIEVWAGVTHGVICGEGPERFADEGCAIKRLYITDTIPSAIRDDLKKLRETGKLYVISWLWDLGLIIFDEHWNESIRGKRY